METATPSASESWLLPFGQRRYLVAAVSRAVPSVLKIICFTCPLEFRGMETDSGKGYMNASLAGVFVFSICSMVGLSKPIDPPMWRQQDDSIVAMAQGQTSNTPQPQPKNKQELTDYTIAYRVTGGSATERAAEDFTSKYP